MDVAVDVDGATRGVALYPDQVPVAVGQGRWRIGAGNARALTAVDDEDAIVDGLRRASIFRKVSIVEVKRVDVVEDHDHRSFFTADPGLEAKASGLHSFQQSKLQRPPRHARFAASDHVQIVIPAGLDNRPVFRVRKLPGIEFTGLEVIHEPKALRRGARREQASEQCQSRSQEY